MSDAIHGHGTTFSIGATAVGNIITIGGPDITRDPLDVSTMDSTSKFREFIPGMLDSGEITLELNYDGTAAGTGNFLSQQMTATAQTMTIVLPAQGAGGTSSWAIAGFMTGLGQAIPFDDKVTQTVTIKLTGGYTYTDSV
jgi:hypothetical protein